MPTIVESHKTIDNKFFYKTADICQLLICKEGEGFSDEEEPSSPVKKKKLDTYKVDKKYLFPHGVAAPLKNCRKRRFRKTLKKKYVEAPEIEKEVKRLLRVDYEAVSVKWEVIAEEEKNSQHSVMEVIKRRSFLQPLALTCTLSIVQLLSGSDMMETYILVIFKDTGVAPKHLAIMYQV